MHPSTMPDTITITCPECDKALKAPESILGKKIRCKGCDAVFTAGGKPTPAKQQAKPAKSAKPAKDDVKKAAPAKPAPQEDEDDRTPFTYKDEGLGNRCPDCANAMESEDAIICLHCGYNTMTRERSRTRKVRDITGMDMFLWLLPGIACAIGFITLVTGNLMYLIMVNRATFGGGTGAEGNEGPWYDFLGSLGMKVWVTIPSIFFNYLMGKFAIKRLAINYKPPEIEEKWKHK